MHAIMTYEIKTPLYYDCPIAINVLVVVKASESVGETVLILDTTLSLLSVRMFVGFL